MHPTSFIIKKDLRFYSVSLSQLYAYQHARCFYCSKYLKFHPYHPENPDRFDGYTIDHLIPRSLGFSKVGNSVLACRGCNEKKGNRMPTMIELVRAWEIYNKMGRPFIASLVFL